MRAHCSASGHGPNSTESGANARPMRSPPAESTAPTPRQRGAEAAGSTARSPPGPPEARLASKGMPTKSAARGHTAAEPYRGDATDRPRSARAAIAVHRATETSDGSGCPDWRCDGPVDPVEAAPIRGTRRGRWVRVREALRRAHGVRTDPSSRPCRSECQVQPSPAIPADPLPGIVARSARSSATADTRIKAQLSTVLSGGGSNSTTTRLRQPPG